MDLRFLIDDARVGGPASREPPALNACVSGGPRYVGTMQSISMLNLSIITVFFLTADAFKLPGTLLLVSR